MKYSGCIGIIGARKGSTRIVNKNIKSLGGIPLIGYTIFTSESSCYIDETIISTDSEEIANVAKNYDSNVKVIMRPSELAQDNSTDYEWILHLLKDFYNKNDFYPEYLVFLRPTTPFRQTKVVDSAIKHFKSNNIDSSLRSIEPLPEAIEKMFKLNENYILYPAVPEIILTNTNLPNQFYPITYKANGYVDILSSEYILKNNDLYGNRILGYITSKTIELDTLEDWGEAEYYMSIGKYDNR